MEIDQIVALLSDHKWAAASVVVIGVLTRMTRDDVKIFPNIDARWRALFAVALGVVSGTLDAIANGKPWLPTLLSGLLAAAVSMSTHDLVIGSIRNGREIGEKKDKDMFPPSGGNGGTPADKPTMFDSLKFKSLALCGLLGLSGCSLLHQARPALEDVAVGAQDAAMVLDLIEEAAKIFFGAAPNADAQAKVEKAVADCRLASIAALRTAQAAENLDQGQVDSAFSAFGASYKALRELCANLGIVGPAGTLSARRGSVAIPDPMVLTMRVRS